MAHIQHTPGGVVCDTQQHFGQIFLCEVCPWSLEIFSMYAGLPNQPGNGMIREWKMIVYCLS